MTDDELKHIGVLGMRWGVRRASTTAGAYAGRAAALRKEGHTKEAAAAERISTVYGAKAKNIQRKIDNYHKFQADLKAIHKSGHGNDMDAIVAAAGRHDKAEAQRKADWKKAPKFTLKEKAYHAFLGDPSVPKGEKIAGAALATAGAIYLVHLSSR